MKSQLYYDFWGSMVATFSLRILSIELCCDHELKASSVIYEDSCFHHRKTLFIEEKIVRQLFIFIIFFPVTLFVLLDVLSLSTQCDIVMGLFEFQFDVIVVICWFCLSVFGVPWRPRSRCVSCQVGYLAPTSWEPPAWNICTPVSIICKRCLWKGTSSDHFIYIIYSFGDKIFVFWENFSFLYCARF